MDSGRIPFRNAEGYPDPTAHQALNAVRNDELERRWQAEPRIALIVKAVRAVVELGGFELGERLVLVDKATGDIYR